VPGRERTPFLVAGASGLVGGALVRGLLSDDAAAEVVAVVRRPSGVARPRVREVVADFGDLDAVSLPEVRTAFCALGTTIAHAGSKEAFRAVDVDAVVAFGRRALRAGASRLLLVSALGADPSSAVFYNRVKGEAEEAVRGLGFAGVALFRPSLLVGERAESRPAERAAIAASSLVSWAMAGPLARWKPVPAETVAAAMRAVAGTELSGVRVLENEEIHRLGSGRRA
jgi:uncharacterized protein YbjT (DUF2867 family)